MMTLTSLLATADHWYPMRWCVNCRKHRRQYFTWFESPVRMCCMWCLREHRCQFCFCDRPSTSQCRCQHEHMGSWHPCNFGADMIRVCLAPSCDYYEKRSAR